MWRQVSNDSYKYAEPHRAAVRLLGLEIPEKRANPTNPHHSKTFRNNWLKFLRAGSSTPRWVSSPSNIEDWQASGPWARESVFLDQ